MTRASGNRGGLSGLVGSGHFFDLLADDVVFEFIITVRDYPRRVVGRENLIELYRAYGQAFFLDRCFDLRVPAPSDRRAARRGRGGASAHMSAVAAKPDRRQRYSLTKRTAMEPSPTAAAARLTEPLRASPAANRPGTLVSSKYGSR